MPETKRIPQDRLAHYFDAFSKRFLMDDSPESAAIEIVGSSIGDQVVTSGARLRGITYDVHTHALEVALESGDRRTYNPDEVWAIEESDGFVSAIDIVQPDGTRELVNIKRG
jgi:hypothetical protein